MLIYKMQRAIYIYVCVCKNCARRYDTRISYTPATYLLRIEDFITRRNMTMLMGYFYVSEVVEMSNSFIWRKTWFQA